jgi:hypothetical protein
MFTVAKIKTVIRETISKDEDNAVHESVHAYIDARDEFGLHATNIQAKRALLKVAEPDVTDESSDEHVKRCAKCHISGKGAHYKIIKAA